MSELPIVELIAIGDELLSGLRENGHLVFLGEILEAHALPVRFASEVRDDEEDLKAAIFSAINRSDIIISTGGLGPTEDDLTVQVMAQCLKRKLISSEVIEGDIVSFFRERGKVPTENNFRQARIIEGAEAIRNPYGTAPGQWIEFEDGKILILLPGPPRELRPMVENQVLQRLVDEGKARKSDRSIHMRTIGVGESMVAHLLEPILAPLRPNVKVAYCATQGYVDVRLTALPNGPSLPQLRQISEECRLLLDDGFLGFGSPEVACNVLKQLRSLNKTIAVAESCTGGLLSSAFTDIPGASKVFMGGIVCYTNDIKENVLGVPGSLLKQHGAVSPECAVAMATAAAELMESDYALSITGYAGPEAGSEPAGTIYLGYHSPVGVWSRKAVLPGNRFSVKERAVTTALDFVRRKLIKYHVHDLLESLRC